MIETFKIITGIYDKRVAIETFKVITGIYDKRVTKDIFHLSKSTTTRGNTYKLEKHCSARDLRKYNFTNRVVDLWNRLADTIVTSKTIHQFENRLDKYWENHQMKYDYNSEYGPPTGRKTVKVEVDDEEELPIEDQKVLRAETT
jgi:chromatin remodeling complex protein RSC6